MVNKSKPTGIKEDGVKPTGAKKELKQEAKTAPRKKARKVMTSDGYMLKKGKK